MNSVCQKRVAIVTGASSGIGLATVKKLLENDVAVFGMARRPEPP